MEVKLKSLKKFYKDYLALDIGEYTFKKGVITGIRGPNGAGKINIVEHHFLFGFRFSREFII